jgi:hypothetical protein|eukprot:COSAG01_NODE_5573_length_4168_cov_21.195583_2_plen_72_part_00
MVALDWLRLHGSDTLCNVCSQHGAMRTIEELGCNPRRREIGWRQSPRTRLRVAIIVVLACAGRSTEKRGAE